MTNQTKYRLFFYTMIALVNAALWYLVYLIFIPFFEMKMIVNELISWLWVMVAVVILSILLTYSYRRRKRKHHHKKSRVRFTYLVYSPTIKEGILIMEINSNNRQKVIVDIKPKYNDGGDAKLDGAPRVTVISGESSFKVADDGSSVEFISADNAGDTTYLLEGDADLGEGVELIQDTIVYHVDHAKAASFGLVAREPVSKL